MWRTSAQVRYDCSHGDGNCKNFRSYLKYGVVISTCDKARVGCAPLRIILQPDYGYCHEGLLRVGIVLSGYARTGPGDRLTALLSRLPKDIGFELMSAAEATAQPPIPASFRHSQRLGLMSDLGGASSLSRRYQVSDLDHYRLGRVPGFLRRGVRYGCCAPASSREAAARSKLMGTCFSCGGYRGIYARVFRAHNRIRALDKKYMRISILRCV